MNIFLKHNKAFKWYTNQTIFFKGYFYIDNHFYEKEDAINFLMKIIKYKELLKNINGAFTIIKKEKNSILIINDITRSFPIFYTFYKNNWLFSDNIFLLSKKTENSNFNSLSEIEFIASNHIYGDKTLLKNVFQTQSSEYLYFERNQIIKRNFYFNYSSLGDNSTSSYEELKKQSILAFENSFMRCFTSMQNRTAVVPLSSGFDSRLIAVMLKKHNFENVICYTYGKKDSFEIKNSRKTAEELGFDWHFIEYNEKITGNFLNSNDFKNYVDYAGKLSSMPNLQEYFAVKYLTENNIIPKDAIFIPGYAGDILGGSEYLKTIPKHLEHNKISELLIDHKMTNYKLSKKHLHKIEIEKILYCYDTNYQKKIPETVFDHFNLKERIAKYIFNSANFYSFFGYEFRFPFWDLALLELFKEVPIQFKRKKKIFDEVLITHYFKPYNVYFENENQTNIDLVGLQKIKNQLKPFLPTFIKQKKLEKNDWNNYKSITNQMILQMEKSGLEIKRTYNNYNEIITQWYLYFSKNKLQ